MLMSWEGLCLGSEAKVGVHVPIWWEDDVGRMVPWSAAFEVVGIGDDTKLWFCFLGFWSCWFVPAKKLPTTTWIGVAATNKPATPPPTTRPSGLANDTVIPPVLLRVPSESLGMNDPDSDNISNRPFKKSTHKHNRQDLQKWHKMREVRIRNLIIFLKSLVPRMSMYHQMNLADEEWRLKRHRLRRERK